jgi:hypothetical protein
LVLPLAHWRLWLHFSSVVVRLFLLVLPVPQY